MVQCSVIVVGIDGAGKSTVINHVKGPAAKRSGELVPTIGCAVEEVKHGNLQLTVFDMAGGSKYRNLWSNYYKEVDGIVYVVDSADAMRMYGSLSLSLSQRESVGYFQLQAQLRSRGCTENSMLEVSVFSNGCIRLQGSESRRARGHAGTQGL